MPTCFTHVARESSYALADVGVCCFFATRPVLALDVFTIIYVWIRKEHDTAVHLNSVVPLTFNMVAHLLCFLIIIARSIVRLENICCNNTLTGCPENH